MAAAVMLQLRQRPQVLLPLLVAAVYCLPRAFPDPPLAQYIARGLLGCLGAWALWRGWRIGAATALCIAIWEGASALCGGLYIAYAPAWEGLCDAGSGVPWTYPSLALTLAATIAEGRRHG